MLDDSVLQYWIVSYIQRISIKSYQQEKAKGQSNIAP